MWDTKSNIFDWVGLSNKQKILIKKLISYFNVPAKGVAIVIDNKCYENSYNPRWRCSKATYMNIKDGGIEEMSPNSLLEIMQSKKYSHLVWISGDVSKSKDIEFIWTLAHELQHLRQDLISTILSKAGNFLPNTLGNIETDEQKIDLLLPTELDAELIAWCVAKNIFGNEIANSGKDKGTFRLSYFNK